MRNVPRRRLRAITIALMLGALTLTGGLALAASRTYPPAVRHAFVSACTKAAVSGAHGKLTKAKATLYCTRALACIAKNLTLAQFEKVALDMQNGIKNKNSKVLTKCERSAVKSLGL